MRALVFNTSRLQRQPPEPILNVARLFRWRKAWRAEPTNKLDDYSFMIALRRDECNAAQRMDSSGTRARESYRIISVPAP
jgi:hypothetical protein